MSIPVDLQRLRAEVEHFGSAAYLLTVNDRARPHAVSVALEWDGDNLKAGTGASTAAYADQRPEVCLLWPAVDDQGYSLIVDGTARTSSDGDRSFVTLAPTKAVLHRSRPAADGSGSSGSDCISI